MQFEWHETKAISNQKKHGVSFLEAKTVFHDLLSLTQRDKGHSDGERRYVTIGMSEALRLLVVVHLETTDRIRIISARKATHKERRIYEAHR